jgi:starch synthase
VTDATEAAIERGEATGFSFPHLEADDLWEAVHRAMLLRRERRDLWRQLALTGMRLDFSWEASARHYGALYAQALADRPAVQSA